MVVENVLCACDLEEREVSDTVTNYDFPRQASVKTYNVHNFNSPCIRSLLQLAQ